MKLTRRQEEFVENLVDLNQKYNGPVHYSQLAERLGVSPFTAYDMLCMLEEKGAVASKFQLASDKSGPGRAERFFAPSESALRQREEMVSRFGTQALKDGMLKQQVIDLISSDKLGEEYYPSKLLARIPQEEYPELSYCAEVLHIVALRLKSGPGRETLLANGPQILSSEIPPRERLLLLGGVIFGILARDKSCDNAWTRKLLEHLEGYTQVVNRIDRTECDQLVEVFTSFFKQLAIEAGIP
jgi:DNA-binding Lrp family transcriptional regulator